MSSFAQRLSALTAKTKNKKEGIYMNGLTVILILFCTIMLLWFAKVWREERRAEQTRRRLLVD